MESLREVAGPHDPDIARVIRPETLRAHYGIDKVQSGCHVVRSRPPAVLRDYPRAPPIYPPRGVLALGRFLGLRERPHVQTDLPEDGPLEVEYFFNLLARNV